MRVVFKPPTAREFSLVFRTRGVGRARGSGLTDIRVFTPPHLKHSRGGGLFSVLGGLAKKAVPFIMKNIAPVATEFGKNVVADVLSGREGVKSAVKKRAVESLKRTGRAMLNSPPPRKRVAGKKKKKELVRKRRGKRRVYKDDVFNV